jgi:hypothetical protein
LGVSPVDFATAGNGCVRICKQVFPHHDNHTFEKRGKVREGFSNKRHDLERQPMPTGAKRCHLQAKWKIPLFLSVSLHRIIRMSVKRYAGSSVRIRERRYLKIKIQTGKYSNEQQDG